MDDDPPDGGAAIPTAIPKGRWRRLGKLGKLGAKAAGSAVLGKAGHKLLATTLAKELGQMKGLPMKFGQLLSYMDGLVPEEQQDLYAQTLAVLRANAPAVDNAACLRVLDEQLGHSRHDVFDVFDDQPLASASIGQVYAAERDGQRLCVKVQYPGIADATAADLQNVDVLMGVAKRLVPNFDMAPLIDNFEARMQEEFDYRREAAYQQRFADLYVDDADIVVPGVVGELSSDLVLTSHRLDGVTFETFLAEASADDRDHLGQTLFRFAFGSLLVHDVFHADPHPGNLLLRCGGPRRLGVLDYGCVQPFDAQQTEALAGLVRAACANAELTPHVKSAFAVDGDDESVALLSEIVGMVLSPISAPQPFTFSRDFAKTISKRVVDAKLKLQMRLLTRKARLQWDDGALGFIARTLFGLAGLWGQLQAQGDFQQLTLGMLEQRQAVSNAG